MIHQLQCAQHLQVHFTSIRCAEVAANLLSRPRERAELVLQLQRDAQILQHMLRETHGRLNQLALISSLPPEILGVIFAFTAEIDQPRVSYTAAPGSLGWIRLTHVCKSWRDICIGTPSLWAHSLGRLPRALLVFLERAGEHVPLRFYLSQDWDTWITGHRSLPGRSGSEVELMNVTKELCARSSRILDLELHFPMAHLASPIERTLRTYHFGSLRRLRIKTLPLYHMAGQQHTPQLFDDLLTVEFTGFFMPFSAPLLTSITLKGIADRLNSRKLYDVCRQCPCLEVIVLSGLESVLFEDIQTRPVIKLPRLAYLLVDLSTSGQEVDTFIKKLDVPRTIQIDVRRASLVTVEDYTLIHTLLKMTDIDGEATALEFIGNSFNLCKLPRSRRWIRVKASVVFGNMNNLAYHLPALHLEPYLKKVAHLTICPLTYATAGDWKRIFVLVPGTGTLELTARGSSLRPLPFATIFNTLGHCFDEDAGMPLPIPLPNLSIVILDSDVEPNLVSMKSDIISCLELRMFAEAPPLRTLCLEGFEEDLVVAHKLRNMVEVVVWKDS